MRNHGIRSSSILSVLYTLLSGTAQAQEAQEAQEAQDSVYEELAGDSRWGDASDPRHYVSLIGKFGPIRDFTINTYRKVFEHVRDDFRESMKSDLWRGDEVTDEQEDKAEVFLSHLDELAAAFRQLLLGEGDLRAVRRAFSNRFRLRQEGEMKPLSTLSASIFPTTRLSFRPAIRSISHPSRQRMSATGRKLSTDFSST
jgi:hypothetical protein